eukprot:scaffold1616_cov310-Pinguiococcus_pyrenoidosus.AAC.17
MARAFRPREPRRRLFLPVLRNTKSRSRTLSSSRTSVKEAGSHTIWPRACTSPAFPKALVATEKQSFHSFSSLLTRGSTAFPDPRPASPPVPSDDLCLRSSLGCAIVCTIRSCEPIRLPTGPGAALLLSFDSA